MKTPTFLFSPKLAVCCLLLLTAACKKDSDAIAPDNSTSLACVGKNLRLAALALDPAQDIDGDGKVDADLLKYMEPCALDNTIKFEQGGTLTGSEGSNVCPSNGDGGLVDMKPSTWTYNAQTRVLRVVPTGNPENASDWQVERVTGTTLRASIIMESEEGNRLKMLMTWQAN